MVSSNALIIFVKNPIPGHVKTRLAATIGNNKAVEAYFLMLFHVRSVVMQLSALKYIYYGNEVNSHDLWDDIGKKKLQVQTKDLGKRMSSAIESELRRYEKVILIGSDTPGISPDIISKGFLKLDNYDIVIGPAKDGGYYLIGMKKSYPTLFDSIKWSTDTVLEKTLKNGEKLGLNYYLLPTLQDVDHEADWKKFEPTLQKRYQKFLNT